jgi:hypothetical protein
MPEWDKEGANYGVMRMNYQLVHGAAVDHAANNAEESDTISDGEQPINGENAPFNVLLCLIDGGMPRQVGACIRSQ